ncbi:MAG: hypothetical protein EZS28_036578 [Streblomastix strix]|uniref:Uncharacterized protein n=1 Tax=Streblomastix strix TaxID=222440 RepID=A0A5J4UE64_9EUKA|nr:MAG: hypothetical protein EZS28_036578 [Streblomastix strix]
MYCLQIQYLRTQYRESRDTLNKRTWNTRQQLWRSHTELSSYRSYSTQIQYHIWFIHTDTIKCNNTTTNSQVDSQGKGEKLKVCGEEDAVADVEYFKPSFKRKRMPSQCFHLIHERRWKNRKAHPHHRANRKRKKWRVIVMSWGEAYKGPIKKTNRKLEHDWQILFKCGTKLGKRNQSKLDAHQLGEVLKANQYFWGAMRRQISKATNNRPNY